ncbi:cation transporter [Marinobacterium sp. AK62]|uniref:Cation transporter n=1 Tax=Marinobacterium alkalitolerans TaxID=1542925 RepID=A0ABS3ZA40_9GAMM|nr:cation transporter [Marinobacterium alkalitolerans]MBP0048565.1 cation transporter [Marinobacterium alkalitolerans]
MSDLDHKPGVKENNLVNRNLKVVTGNADMASLANEIDQLYGVDSVSWEPDKSVLRFAYDATHCNLDIVEALVREKGAAFADGWWNRVKRNYYRFVDENMRDNASHEPHCCNKVPRK